MSYLLMIRIDIGSTGNSHCREYDWIVGVGHVKAELSIGTGGT